MEKENENKNEQEFKSVLYCMRKEYVWPYTRIGSDMKKVKSAEETKKYWEEEERKKQEQEQVQNTEEQMQR